MRRVVPEKGQVASLVASCRRGDEIRGVKGCPACGTLDTGDHYSSLNVEDGTVTQGAACDVCGAEWDEIYSIDRIWLRTPPHVGEDDAARYPAGLYYVDDR